MPDRMGEQADRIAGQYFWDVYFIGGTISNITIDGITTFLSVREVTVSGDIDVLITDSVIAVENNAASPVNVNLLAADTAKIRSIYIKDARGNAGTNNITIVPDGADTIDGASTLVMNVNYQAFLLTPITGGWIILA